MKIKSDGSLIFFIILIVVFALSSGKAEQKAYDEGYAAAQAEYEEEIDNCNGQCSHVQNAIENFIDDGILIYRENVFYEDDIYSEDDMEEQYWEGAYEGYIQGYGDRYYGNERELDISDYEDEHMF